MNDLFHKSQAPLAEEIMIRVRNLKDVAEQLLEEIKYNEPCRERSLAETKLEECVMWAVKGVTK